MNKYAYALCYKSVEGDCSYVNLKNDDVVNNLYYYFYDIYYMYVMSMCRQSFGFDDSTSLSFLRRVSIMIEDIRSSMSI